MQNCHLYWSVAVGTDGEDCCRRCWYRSIVLPSVRVTTQECCRGCGWSVKRVALVGASAAWTYAAAQERYERSSPPLFWAPIGVVYRSVRARGARLACAKGRLATAHFPRTCANGADKRNILFTYEHTFSEIRIGPVFLPIFTGLWLLNSRRPRNNIIYIPDEQG